MSLPKIVVAPSPLPEVPRPFKPHVKKETLHVISEVNLKEETPHVISEVDMKEETLLSWFSSMAKSSTKSLPMIAKKLAIPLAVIALVNLVLWPLQTWKMPSSLSNLVMLLIFFTATYNNFIPKTIFWVIVFTFGKRLFFRFRKQGFKAFDPLKQIVPQLKTSYAFLQERGRVYLLLGVGVGLIVANYFASYSRFSGARNKFDKYFVALVVAFAVTYMLGESNQGGIFKFVRLLINDISRTVKSSYRFHDSMSHLLFGGFVMGLLLDALLIAMKLMYGGYILGAICVVISLILPFVSKKTQST